MRLGNILAQQGGVAESGHPVKFQVRQKVAGGRTVRKWAEAVILPISEDERARVGAQARIAAEKDGAADFETERSYGLVAAMLHDPEDLRVKWATAEDMPRLRQALVWPQVKWLLSQYDQHIESEYPELLTPAQGAKLEAEAEGN